MHYYVRIKMLYLLEKNIKNTNWKYLVNINSEKLIKDNLNNKVYEFDFSWVLISNKDYIFEIDYDRLKISRQFIIEELMKKCYHPKRLNYYLLKYNYDIGSDTYNCDY